MKREFMALEIRQGRNRLKLEKIVPGELLLAAVAAPISFFYKITLNGSMRDWTTDPHEAQRAFREDARWLSSGNHSAGALA
jgi:hypothetical protein